MYSNSGREWVQRSIALWTISERDWPKTNWQPCAACPKARLSFISPDESSPPTVISSRLGKASPKPKDDNLRSNRTPVGPLSWGELFSRPYSFHFAHSRVRVYFEEHFLKLKPTRLMSHDCIPRSPIFTKQRVDRRSSINATIPPAPFLLHPLVFHRHPHKQT